MTIPLLMAAIQSKSENQSMAGSCTTSMIVLKEEIFYASMEAHLVTNVASSVTILSPQILFRQQLYSRLFTDIYHEIETVLLVMANCKIFTYTMTHTIC